MSVADVSHKPITELIAPRGRCAVATGAAQGLGKAIACRFAEAGAAVLIGDVKEDLARSTAEALSRSAQYPEFPV